MTMSQQKRAVSAEALVDLRASGASGLVDALHQHVGVRAPFRSGMQGLLF